jgi:hypothetical protein
LAACIALSNVSKTAEVGKRDWYLSFSFLTLWIIGFEADMSPTISCIQCANFHHSSDPRRSSNLYHEAISQRRFPREPKIVSTNRMCGGQSHNLPVHASTSDWTSSSAFLEACLVWWGAAW